jgi:hypothetical protein
MTACLACGYDATVAAPILDAHARAIATYLSAPAIPIPATTRELHDKLGIPLGTLHNKWFRARARTFGVVASKSGRGRVWIWGLA